MPKKIINCLYKMIPLMLAALLVFSSVNGQEDWNATFEKANQLYQQKNYTEALNQYALIVESGLQSAELFYNIGNAHYENQQLGQAIANYKKALRLAPGDEDIRYNLSLAREQRVDELIREEGFFLTAWWNKTRSLLSSTAWGVLFILLLWSSAFGFYRFLSTTDRSAKKQGFKIGILCFLLCIIPFFFAMGQYQNEQADSEAVIIAAQLSLKNAPDDKSDTLIKLHEGTEVELLDKIGDWYQVKLIDQEIGWLPQNGLQIVY